MTAFVSAPNGPKRQGGSTANVKVVVFKQSRQCRHGRLRLRTDAAQGRGGGTADQVVFVSQQRREGGTAGAALGPMVPRMLAAQAAHVRVLVLEQFNEGRDGFRTDGSQGRGGAPRERWRPCP